MSNNKQSSIEWLQAIELERDLTLADWNKAKEMHKDEILIAYDNGWESGYYNPEEYYTEKFESKK